MGLVSPVVVATPILQAEISSSPSVRASARFHQHGQSVQNSCVPFVVAATFIATAAAARFEFRWRTEHVAQQASGILQERSLT